MPPNNTNANTWEIVLAIPILIPIQLKNPIPIPIPILLANSGTYTVFYNKGREERLVILR